MKTPQSLKPHLTGSPDIEDTIWRYTGDTVGKRQTQAREPVKYVQFTKNSFYSESPTIIAQVCEEQKTIEPDSDYSKHPGYYKHIREIIL